MLCPVCCGVAWIAGSHSLELVLHCGLSLKKKKIPKPSLRPIVPLTPLCLVMHGRRASSACLSPSPLSQDIPACEEHADVQIPQVMREFITRGTWAIQEWQPDHSLKLERSLGPAREAQIADAHGRGQAGMGPSAPQAGGPAAISPLLLGTTGQTINQGADALCPLVVQV